jgi:hypothetical protein
MQCPTARGARNVNYSICPFFYLQDLSLRNEGMFDLGCVQKANGIEVKFQ